MSPNENQSSKLHNVEQGSEEWFALRTEYPLTASDAQAIGNQGVGLETLVWKKLSEKYSQTRETLNNKDLERGRELEPIAAEIYELETGNKVEVVGFVTNESVSKVGGASPDRFVGEDGLLEIKAFADIKHFQNIVNGLEIESQYLWQMQMQMLFTGRKWCDFAAYNPNYKKSLLIRRVEIDMIMQAKLITGLKMGELLLAKIEEKYKKI